VLQPPVGLIEEIQRQLVDFFWSGQHWIRAAALYLPLQEGGQGLIDIRARIMAFRLQATQRLLYDTDASWQNTACALLRRVRGMGLDKHLFLMELQNEDRVKLTVCYKSVLEAWTVFTISRTPNTHAGLWLFEEPLFLNDFLPSRLVSGPSLRACFTAAGCTKLGHILTKSLEELSEMTGVRSLRLLKQATTGILKSLHADHKYINDDVAADQWRRGVPYVFPSLNVTIAVGERQDDENCILSYETPQLGVFEEVGKKALYISCVEASNAGRLHGFASNKWTDFFGILSSPRGCWRSLKKRPIDKRTGDLQWWIVHGAIVRQIHGAH